MKINVDVAHFWWAVGLSAFGCALLLISLFLVPIGEIATSVITAVGLLFTFSGAIVGIQGSVNTKLAQFQQSQTKRENNPE